MPARTRVTWNAPRATLDIRRRLPSHQLAAPLKQVGGVLDEFPALLVHIFAGGENVFAHVADGVLAYLRLLREKVPRVLAALGSIEERHRCSDDHPGQEPAQPQRGPLFGVFMMRHSVASVR